MVENVGEDSRQIFRDRSTQTDSKAKDFDNDCLTFHFSYGTNLIKKSRDAKHQINEEQAWIFKIQKEIQKFQNKNKIKMPLTKQRPENQKKGYISIF